MSSKQTDVVHKIELQKEQPTDLTFTDLREWVIWQYPQQSEDGLSGAVRPSIPKAPWYPARIYPKEKRVQVYAHLDTSFNSPEKAAAQIQLSDLAI